MSEQKATTEVRRHQLKLASCDDQLIMLVDSDVVAVEQPLQITVTYFERPNNHWQTRQLAVVMRTPGQDKVLVIGYLITQGVIKSVHDISDISLAEENVAEVTLDKQLSIEWSSFTRLFASHSGCGVCGQAQLKQLALKYESFTQASWLPAADVLALPELLRSKQEAFGQTGGIHGAAIWQANELLYWAEDVGRHNAVDKVVGELLINNKSAKQSVLILSGRISFELVQKALVAGISAIVAVGAPSDLAIATAKQFNQTLIGFVKAQQANVYCGEQQLK